MNKIVKGARIIAEEIPLDKVCLLKTEEEVHSVAEEIAERVAELMRFDASATISCADTISYILRRRWKRYVSHFQGTTLEAN